jgi:hypothetical protein
MSTWISEVRAAPGLWATATLILILAGCFETAPPEDHATRHAAPGPAALPVLDGAVTVAGPRGYCVDTAATAEGATEAFVLMIRCRGADRHPVLAATITALPAEAAVGAANLAALKEAITGPTGRAYLSRTGAAEDIRIDEAQMQEGAIWLRIHDRGTRAPFAPDYWRAILPVGARVVTLSVLDARDAPLTRAAGLSILRDFAGRMRAANRD